MGKKDKDTNQGIAKSIELLKAMYMEQKPKSSLYDGVKDKQDELLTLAQGSPAMKQGKKKTKVVDSYRNLVEASGMDDMVQSFTNYGFSNNTLNWALWMTLYNDSWVFRRAIDKPAQDEVNAGFTLHGDNDYSNIYKTYNKYKFDMIQLLQWGALFGGAIGVMMFDGLTDEELGEPLQPEKIKGKRMRIYVVDRWYGVAPSNETVTNMRDIDFGQPVYYDVWFANGHCVRVHHAYVLRYEHRTAPKLLKVGQLQGWGYAEGSHIINELARDDQIKSSITSLISKSLIEIVKMSGMRGVFMGADVDNEEQLRKRLEMVNWARTYNSLTLLDKDDEYDQRQINMSGLSEILEKNMWLVAAALEMQGVLFGDLKGGLSQESDAFERYSGTIKNRCDSYYRPVLQKLLEILFIREGIEDESPDFEFNEIAQTKKNLEKMEAIDKFNATLTSLAQLGAIDKYGVAVSMQTFINRNSMDIKFNDDMLDVLKLQSNKEVLKAYKDLGHNKEEELKNEILSNQFPNETHTKFGIDENNELVKEEVKGTAPEGTEFGSSEEMNQAFKEQEQGNAPTNNVEPPTE